MVGMTLRLSVLDQSPIAEGGSGADALCNSLELARLADDLGYHRYWLAEHHATPALASAVPEVLLSAVLQATSRIRVGTGGIMLPHQSPFRVAEAFSMLAALAPGRVDLGLGRAPGSDPLTAYALQQDRRQRAPNEFPAQLAELLAYFDDALPADHPFARLAQTLPGGAAHPAIWVLGSSTDSADLAGALGLPYCVAEFIAGDVPELADRYRAAFRPSQRLAAPEVLVAAWVVAADTADTAHRLASSSRMMFAKMLQGELIAVPHPDKAAIWLDANPPADRPGRNPIVGTAEHCRDALQRVANRYGADEVMLVNILHDHAARLQSYRIMADAFEAVAA